MLLIILESKLYIFISFVLCFVSGFLFGYLKNKKRKGLEDEFE